MHAWLVYTVVVVIGGESRASCTGGQYSYIELQYLAYLSDSVPLPNHTSHKRASLTDANLSSTLLYKQGGYLYKSSSQAYIQHCDYREPAEIELTERKKRKKDGFEPG